MGILDPKPLTKQAADTAYGPDAPGMKSAFGLGNIDGTQTAVLFGDSIIAQCGDDASAQAAGLFDAYSWTNWAQMFLGYPLSIVKNAGIGGNTTTQMLARIDTDVKPYDSDWVIMDGGINDVFNGGGTTLATMQSNLAAIFDKITKNYGRKVMMMLPTGSGFGTPATFTVLYQLHRWLKKYAREHRGIYLFDGHGWYCDPADGMPILGYVRPEDNPTAQARGVHPGYLGAAKIGRALADAMQIPLDRAGASYTTTNADPLNLISNGRITGDVSGMATSWSLLDNSGAAAQGATATKVSRTDGKPGTVQQIVWDGTGSACKFYQQNTDTTKWATGDQVFAEVEFETEPDTAGGYGSNKSLALIVNTWNAGTTGTASSLNYRGADGTLPAGVDIYPRKGSIRTTALTVPAGTLRLQLSLYLPKGTTRILSASLRKVDY